MPHPSDRRYLDSHEWHRLADGVVTIGISQFAVDELTDVTYVEFRMSDGRIDKGEPFAEVESVKSNSEVYAGVAGEVVAVNDAVVDEPQKINEDCYGDGWLIKIKPDDPAAVEALMDGPAYEATLG